MDNIKMLVAQNTSQIMVQELLHKVKYSLNASLTKCSTVTQFVTP